MKKLVQFSVFLVLILSTAPLINSCQKDKTPTSNYSVQGLWTGTQQSSGSAATTFAMCFKPDGTATYENTLQGTQQFCVGTWTLNGTTLTCNTTCIYGLSFNVGVKQTFTATFNPSNGTLSSGQWVNTYPPAAALSGTFSLSKVD